MPLEKRWRGRRVTRTRRRGPWIMVRLTAEPEYRQPAEWIRMTPAAYEAERTCVYQPATVLQAVGGGP